MEDSSRNKEKWVDQYVRLKRGLRWPNELLIKSLFSKSYFTQRYDIPDRSRVLDVGCGSGCNLLPLLDVGHECHGVEIHPEIAAQAADNIKTWSGGKTAEITVGHNRSLPYPDAYFDLLLSVYVLHYEQNEEDFMAGLKEYARVLKLGGVIFVSTVGTDSPHCRNAELLGPHRYRLRNLDFRDGQIMFYVGTEKYLSHYVGQVFDDVESARAFEMFPHDLNEYIFCMARRRR
jgi:SAM-dependent methyltransferase